MLGLAACQNDPEGLNVNADGTVNTTLSVTLPEATRAGSDVGGLTHFNSATHDIRYILEVYNDAGKLVKERDTKLSDAGTVVFDLRLIPNRDYNFVVWADFVENGSKADCYYNTDAEGAGLRNVSVVEGKWTAMNELRDAYTGVKRIEGYNSSSTIDLTLTRPFAKLRVVTTDIDELYGILPEKVQVEYRTDVYRGFDAFAAEAKNASTKDFDYTLEDVYDDFDDTVNRTLFTDYLFGTAKGSIQFDMYIGYNDNGSTTTLNFNTEIPVERNYLTTVKGNLLTDDNDFTVTIDESFAGYNNDGGNVVTTNEELKAALTQDVENIAVVLGANLTYDVAAWDNNKMGGDKTKTITISGVENTRAAEPYTLTFNLTGSDWCNVVANGTLVLKNLNINTTGYNTGHWKHTHLNFNCDVEIENVTSTPIELGGNSVVKNLTINNAYSDTYALWIGTRGQEINIDGLVINSADNGNRGIKIADEDRESKAVTLNIKNAEFNTAKKAAILATTNYGATINVGENVNIENVAADPINAVWVDEERPATFDDIVVTGASKVIEGTPASDVTLVKTSEELTAALASVKVDAVIALADGLYEGGFHINKGLTLKAVNKNGAKINGKIGITGGGVVNIEGIEFSNNYTGSLVTDKGHVDNHTGKFCIGLYCAYVNVKDCTFNLYDTGGVYYYAFNYPEFCTIKNCTFNCNGFRPIYSKVNVEIDGCTFVDQYRYSVQIYGNKNNGNETVKFTNNTIINPAVTSGKPYAAGVQISNGYDLNNVAFTIEGNTLESAKFNDLKFAYDYQQSGENLVEMTTCTLNGEAIVDAQCVVIPTDTKVKEVLDGILVPAVVDGAYQINNAEEFMYINERGMGSVTGLTFLADIDLEGREINPILKDGIVVKGNNKTISNFSITNKTQAALFGDTNNFNISDLTIADATFSAKNVDGEDSAAAFIGFMEAHSNKDHILTNCHVLRCTIGSAKYVGGLVAFKDGSAAPVQITNCSVTGSTIKSLYTEDNGVNYKGHCGGVIGYFASITEITNCTVTGNTFEVKGPRCGAFIGTANYNTTVLSGKCSGNNGLDTPCGSINQITDWSNVVTE